MDLAAVADFWADGQFTLTVVRDGREEVWGHPVAAATPDDMPAAAEAKLQAPVAYRVAGPWMAEDGPVGPRWRAPVEQVG